MFGLPTGMVVRIAAVLAVVAALYFFANYFSAKGASDERLKTAEESLVVQENTQESIVTRNDQAIDRTQRSRETLDQTQQAVWQSQGADAPLPQEVVDAWAVGIDRLRDDARCARDRAACSDPERVASALPTSSASTRRSDGRSDGGILYSPGARA